MTLQMMIEYNNATVALLRQQDLSNAVVSSTTAMELLQEVQRTSSPPIVSSARTPICPPDCLDQCMMLFHFDTISVSENPYRNDSVFVYDKGIVIPPSMIRATMESLEMVSSILIFNSALAHQLYAHQLQDSGALQRCLVKAKRLYQLGLEAYRDTDKNTLFQFVVINNIAVIELQTGNTALSRDYFENLLMPIRMLLVDQGDWSRLQHLRGFLRNFAFFQEAKAASAA